MTKPPERIHVLVGGSPVCRVLRQEWLLEPSEIAVTVEYIRADLVEAAVKRAIEACAEACDDNHRGDLPKHIQSADGLLLRKWLSDPETIAKIIGGGE